MKRQPNQDAFGQEIWTHLQTGYPYEIVERDDGHIDTAANTASYFAPFSKWPVRQKLAMRLVRGKRVLDVGCGAGRVALYLQGRGFTVTAIDNSPLAIKTCRKRGVKDARLVPFERVSRFGRGMFDAVIMFGNNFGLFGSRRKAQALLGELHRVTSENAVILAESIDPYKTNNPFHRRYHARNRRRGRMAGQLRIRIRFQGYMTPWFDYLFVSPTEMNEIVDGTGWTLDRVIKDTSVSYIGVIKKQ
jgi:SAM-dependent methyltransferase